MTRAIAGMSVMGWMQLAASDAAAQQWRFRYPEPSAEAVRVTRGVRYAIGDTLPLAMDVYRPAASSGPAPAIIFYQMYWPAEGRPPRESNDYPQSWARIAAAHGIVGIVPDIRAEPGTGTAARPSRPLGDDFRRLTAYVTERAADFGIDRERVAVFAASGSVWAALPEVQDTTLTAIKAAVMYYGAANVTAFRTDLPMLYVRAGLDSPAMNAEIVRLASLAISQNAPLTLRNHHMGSHAFEASGDDTVTRQVIDETIRFVTEATAPAFQAAIRRGHLDALAAGQSSTGNYRGASETLARILENRPTDGRARYAYGNALLADKRYTAACTQFRLLTPRSFAAILPGTRSCVLGGIADSAVAWLGTMPKNWLRSEYVRSLRTDSVFAPLWPRPDFQALFQPDSLGTTR